MGDSTHTMAVNGIDGQDTAQVTVPAQVQRDEGICIDDEVAVTVHDPNELVDTASFTNRQTGGDRVTIPADVSRRLGIEDGVRYEFEFEAVGDDEEDEADEADEAESIDDILDDLETDTDDEDEADESEATEETEDEEDKRLGELFG